MGCRSILETDNSASPDQPRTSLTTRNSTLSTPSTQTWYSNCALRIRKSIIVRTLQTLVPTLPLRWDFPVTLTTVHWIVLGSLSLISPTSRHSATVTLSRLWTLATPSRKMERLATPTARTV